MQGTTVRVRSLALIRAGELKLSFSEVTSENPPNPILFTDATSSGVLQLPFNHPIYMEEN